MYENFRDSTEDRDRDYSNIPEYLLPDEYDRTLEGHLEMLQDLKVTQRALNLDFRVQALADKPTLHRLAEPALAEINFARDVDLDIAAVSDNFLVGLIQPNWSAHIPTLEDGTDEDLAWEEFKAGFNENIQINLEQMRILHSKIKLLEGDEILQEALKDHNNERVHVLRAAATWRIAERKQKELGKQISEIRLRASASKRQSLTPGEVRAIANKEDQIKELENDRNSLIIGPETRDMVIVELNRASALDQKHQLESGLLMTDQMQKIINEVLPALSRGEPALIVGETGGAKTALARYLSTEYFGVTPELVSGYGDANSYQLMGKQELREKNGATVSEFMPGPIVRAMEQGLPLILDEINAMPPELIKRLNLIVQLRPGDTFTVQEDSGRQVTVAPGFCIIATANEKSKRYKAVDDLSVEFQNRFGANIYRVHYPDANKSYAEDPLENAMLVNAAIIDKDGKLPPDLDLADLWALVRAARVSQQVFSGEHGIGFIDFVPQDRRLDNRPGLEETVLAPRTLVDIVRGVAGSYGQQSLESALRRFVDGIKNANDREAMVNILKGHNLLRDPEPETDPIPDPAADPDPTATPTATP